MYETVVIYRWYDKPVMSRIFENRDKAIDWAESVLASMQGVTAWQVVELDEI